MPAISYLLFLIQACKSSSSSQERCFTLAGAWLCRFLSIDIFGMSITENIELQKWKHCTIVVSQQIMYSMVLLCYQKL